MLRARSQAPEPADGGSGPVRVLIVDDSAYMRHVIGKGLSADPGLTIVGTARDGREALDLVPRLKPDVVTLDVEMPHLDGLSTLRQLMALHPVPVVMLSSLTKQGTSETIQALAAGAVDFVAKPDDKANIAAVLAEVIGKVRLAAHAQVRRIAAPRAAGPAGAAARDGYRPPGRPAVRGDKVVVIGASTGGPRALHTVFEHLPPDLPAAVLIVQHMPAGFTRSLAERLDNLARFPVKEAEPGDAVQVGRGLLAPGGFHLTLDAREQVALNQNPAVHGVRPAIDVTMMAAAEHFGAAVIGVVLTGMGHDGTNGSALIHRSGGYVIAEAASTCVVWGMPRSVEEAGLADRIVPLDQVGEAIAQAVRR
jgi:two-component system chemotaxis response regulator CheB